MKTSPVGTYFRQTRGLYYSYLLAVPLFILYEFLIRFSQPNQEQMVRISVDIWFQTFFRFFGLDALTATLIVAGIIGAIILYKRKGNLPPLKFHYFGWLIAECIGYALIITLLINLFLEMIFQMNLQAAIQQLSKTQLFALSLGAGLYEELFFRVILVSGLFYLFSRSFSSKKAYVLAAIVAALAFSGVHYIGEFGDPFAINSFLFRFLFGLALNVIYVIRGFGCAAWTHAIYDLIIVFYS